MCDSVFKQLYEHFPIFMGWQQSELQQQNVCVRQDKSKDLKGI